MDHRGTTASLNKPIRLYAYLQVASWCATLSGNDIVNMVFRFLVQQASDPTDQSGGLISRVVHMHHTVLKHSQ